MVETTEKIEIYSGRFCPYCVRAKSLLKKREMTFIEYDIQADPEKQAEMVERSQGARSIPQIFINGHHLGGCDDLYALDRKGDLKGELAAWLAARQSSPL